ncbi:hypothetical protein pVa21_218 [Vibrio phage pVa-21]|nr:hypothetical protein pVa21_218 [Vibrio phage pVa-21]
MNVIEFYQALLESTGLVVSEAGHVLRPTKDQDPLQIEGKDVVLPNKFYLSQNDWSDVHPFHPLCEDALMGQSPTFHLLNSIIRIALSQRYAALIKDILKVATTKELQQQIKDPSANEITMVFPDMKSGAIKSWTSVYATFAQNQYFAGLYISRNLEIDGQQYQRVGTVRYPILEDDSESSLLGVKITKKDTAGLRALVGKIVEPIPNEFGSNSAVPYFDTLIQFYVAMVKRYNELVEMFGDVLSTKAIPTEWMEGYDELEKLRKRIPKLPGNAGVRVDAEEKRNAGIEVEDDDAFANVKVPATSRRKVEDDDDTPPWDEDDERPQDRRHTPKTGGSILDMTHRRDDYDDEDDRYSRRRGRDSRRDRRDDRRSSRRDDRRDDRRSRRDRGSRRDDRRSGGSVRDFLR